LPASPKSEESVRDSENVAFICILTRTRSPNRYLHSAQVNEASSQLENDDG